MVNVTAPGLGAAVALPGRRRVTPARDLVPGEDRPGPRAPGAVVVKLGGRALEEHSARAAFAAEVGRERRPLVLVHGGGAEVSAWSGRLGLTSRFVDGLRVTDPATLELAVAVLAGLANKRLVAALRDAGADAVGLAALDGGVAEVAPHPAAGGLGAVGEVRGVRAALLLELLRAGRVPVLASIGDHGGALLNLNADDLAGAVAAALGADRLLLLSDVPGVRVEGAVLETLPAGAIPELLAHPEVRDGIRPKLRAAAVAAGAGVAETCIGQWSGPGSLARLLAGEQPATRIRPESARV
jgi:acetylglutamate kinase